MEKNNDTEKVSLAYKTKAIINKYGFTFKKNFGQNFLVDERVLEKIADAAGLTEDDIVLEVGPGIGTLTAALARRAKKVIAVEIDKTLIPILEETLADYDNIEIINEDILKVDLVGISEKYGRKLKVAANLPYYITTPIIMDILEKQLPIESMTVMIQKEVAYRMQAKPDTKDYGSLSLMVQYYSEAYLAANVPRNCFMPRPNVDSAVIRLTLYDEPPVKVKDREFFFKFIKAAFSMRRKTLVNCIYNSFNGGMSKEELEEILSENGYDEKIRGEKLSIEDFAGLSDVFFEKL
ncbi:MAG: 16S rRNA (adenine(1518)-N(6)/adenine(1519)-N(6))-dimethyltransferase RsmA [Firmicutes bacterium]|nr:16S rRNA (adenine(1518)-N(6)/adenine(1519)-N(6))-dimethyltransferase RsmA [Bacillota bacterium]